LLYAADKFSEFNVTDVAPDGNCQFASIALQLTDIDGITNVSKWSTS